MSALHFCFPTYAPYPKPMKFFSTFLFSFLLLSAVSAQTSIPTYYKHGKPDVLTISTKQLLVRLENGSSKAAFEKSVLVPLNLSSEWLAPMNSFRIHTQKLDESQRAKLTARVEKLNYVRHVYPAVEKHGSMALVNNVLLIQPKTGRIEEVLRLLPEFGTLKDKIDLGAGTILISVESYRGTDVFAASRKIYETGLTEIAEPDFMISAKTDLTPNDVSYGKQWYLNSKDDHDIDAPEAWNVTTGSAIVVVAVLDGNGFDQLHPDFVANSVGKIVNPYDAVNNDNDPSPENADANHGTPCAGLVAGGTNNNLGVASVGYNIKVMPICIGFNATGRNFDCSAEIIARAASRVISQFNCVATSNSWASGSADFGASIEASYYSMRINSRSGLGAINLCAYGNDAILNPEHVYPANFTTSYTVTATNSLDTRASFSNYGVSAKIAAPGEGGIYTMDRQGQPGYSSYDYADFSGTSASTPIVAGVVGLIGSISNTFTAFDFERILGATADKVSSTPYTSSPINYPHGTWNTSFGYGRVNAYRAVLMAKACVPANPTSCYPGNNSINGFWLNTLANQNSGCNGLAFNYISYGTQQFTTDLRVGATYSPVIIGGTEPQVFGIWLDANGDGDLSDAGEFLYASTYSSTYMVGNITIPNNLNFTGKRLLRVRSRGGSTPFSASEWCTPSTTGETEDYIVTLTNLNMMNGDVSICSGLFYDSGGQLKDYAQNENLTLTVRPSASGYVSSVTFNSMDINLYSDSLVIYNGTGTSGAILGVFDYISNPNPTIPVTFTSTAADGSLTFKFKSDHIGYFGGWSALLTCIGVLNPGVLSNSSQVLCSPADPGLISFVVPPTTGASYRWYYKNGLAATPAANDDITGWTDMGITTSYLDPPAGLIQSRTYACRVSNQSYSRWASGVSRITVPDFYYGRLASANQTFSGSGNPAVITFSTAPVNDPVGTFTYQWYSKPGIQVAPTGTVVPTGWTAISGATDVSYDPPTQSASISYCVMVNPTGTPGCAVARWALGVRQITVNPVAFNPGTIASGNQTICYSGDPAIIGFSTAAPAGSMYQWYYRAGIIPSPATTDDVTGWTLIANATAANYDAPTGLIASRTYACRVENFNAYQWAHGVRQVDVLPPVEYGSITPGDQTFCNSGDPAPIDLNSFPKGSGGYEWRWYWKNNATGTCPTGSSIAGLGSNTTSPNVTGTTQSGGGITFDPTSAGVVGEGRIFSVLITPIAFGAIPACGTPRFVSNCRKIFVNDCTPYSHGTLAEGNQTLCYNGDPAPISFSATPPAGSTYLWYYKNGIVPAPVNTATTAGWTLIPGAPASTYDPPSLLTNSRTFACRVSKGGTSEWATGVRQVTVLPVFNPGTVASGDQTLCPNGNPNPVSLSVLPSGSASFTYQWYFKAATYPACPTGGSTVSWAPISLGTSPTYDPQSAGVAGRTFAMFVTPTGTPTCGTPSWSTSCRKTFVVGCREGAIGEAENDEIKADVIQHVVMDQNIPNPWNAQTRFTLFLPENTKDAEIRISGLDGRLYKVIPINGTGNVEVELTKENLAIGLYFYSLWTNQQPVAVKKMVLIR